MDENVVQTADLQKRVAAATAKLLTVCDLITQEPRRIQMGLWRWRWFQDHDDEIRAAQNTGVANLPPNQLAPCGTVGCIAGWLCEANGYTGESQRCDSAAAQILDIRAHRLSTLFFPAGWPDELKQELDDHEPGTPDYAAVVVKRIKFFIVDELEDVCRL